ncbi:MAG: TolC family protein [Duncaniella sp.]|nr:TolC family protein [Duncaniella sp.]
MKGLITALLAVACAALSGAAQSVTIDECVRLAEENYPAIKKYELLHVTTDIELADISKSWLPRIGVYGQGTVQNVVPSFPEALTGVLDMMGQSLKGLGKAQYKAGVDVTQTLWDGGTAGARRDVARSQEAVRRSALDVELYAVRQRVESVFFAILLTERQTERNEVTHNLLTRNLERLRAMFRNGVAMQSDVDMVEAQMLAVAQSIAQGRSAAKGYRKALELFIGESLEGKTLECPQAEMPAGRTAARPELRLFDSRAAAAEAALRLSDTSLMPRVGLFAQAYYGYPGFDYFKSMMTRDLSFNVMAGVKVSWNIDSFYTRRNNLRRTTADLLDIAADRETFMFNTELQAASQSESIDGLREVISDDARIIALRENVRLAAESQLENGIIDATALLTKISDENVARLNGCLHEIQLIKEIYDLKYTLNQ